MDIIRYSYPQKYKDKGLSSLFLHLMKQYVKKKNPAISWCFSKLSCNAGHPFFIRIQTL